MSDLASHAAKSLAGRAAALPPGVRRFHVERIPGISVRARSGLPRNGVHRIEDLIGLADATLGAWQNFGAGTVESVRDGLEELAALAAAEPALTAGTYAEIVERLTVRVCFLAALEAAMDGMSEVQLAILRQRLLAEGDPQTLEAVAEPFGLTRERIRQLEVKTRTALDPRGDLRTASSARLGRLREGRTEPLSLGELEERDPWFAGVAERPAFFAATLDALDSDHAVAAWDDGVLFVTSRAATPAESLIRALRTAKDGHVSTDALEEAVRRGLQDCSAPELASGLRARLEDFIVCRRGLVFDPNLQDRVESIFVAAQCPLTIAEVGRRLSRAGRSFTPTGVRGFVDRLGLVRTGPSEYVLPAQLASFDDQAASFYEAVAPLIEAAGERQWSTAELLGALGGVWTSDLPEHAAEYLLSLEASPCRRLGRGMWGSPRAVAQKRLRLVDVATGILEEAGAPLDRVVLEERVRAIRSFKFHVTIQWPLVHLPDGRVGLGPRDLGVSQAAFDVVLPEIQRRLAEVGRVSAAVLRTLVEAVEPSAVAVEPTLLARAFRVGSRVQIDGSGEGDGLRWHDVAREGTPTKAPRRARGVRRRTAPGRAAPEPAPPPKATPAPPVPAPAPMPPSRRRLTTTVIQARVRAKLGRDLPIETLRTRLRLAGWSYDPAADAWTQDEPL